MSHHPVAAAPATAVAYRQHKPPAVANFTSYTPKDVLSGRGKGAQLHPGNVKYRELVSANKLRYSQCVKSGEKTKLAKAIVAEVREDGGRFLELEERTGVYNDIGDKRAIEKTSQALREGQTKIRREGKVASTPLLGGGREVSAEQFLSHSSQEPESLCRAHETTPAFVDAVVWSNVQQAQPKEQFSRAATSKSSTRGTESKRTIDAVEHINLSKIKLTIERGPEKEGNGMNIIKSSMPHLDRRKDLFRETSASTFVPSNVIDAFANLFEGDECGHGLGFNQSANVDKEFNSSACTLLTSNMNDVHSNLLKDEQPDVTWRKSTNENDCLSSGQYSRYSTSGTNDSCSKAGLRDGNGTGSRLLTRDSFSNPRRRRASCSDMSRDSLKRLAILCRRKSIDENDSLGDLDLSGRCSGSFMSWAKDSNFEAELGDGNATGTRLIKQRPSVNEYDSHDSHSSGHGSGSSSWTKDSIFQAELRDGNATGIRLTARDVFSGPRRRRASCGDTSRDSLKRLAILGRQKSIDENDSLLSGLDWSGLDWSERCSGSIMSWVKDSNFQAELRDGSDTMQRFVSVPGRVNRPVESLGSSHHSITSSLFDDM